MPPPNTEEYAGLVLAQGCAFPTLHRAATLTDPHISGTGKDFQALNMDKDSPSSEPWGELTGR